MNSTQNNRRLLFLALILIALFTLGYASPVSYSASQRKVLIVKDVDPWGNPSNEQALTQLGYAYDVVNSTQFLTTDLAPYDVIIIASDQPTSFYNTMASPTAIQKLKNFVGRGGVLLAHMTDQGWSGGLWTTSFLPGAPNLTHVSTYLNDLTVVAPTHPVIVNSNTTNTSIDGWGYSAHGYFQNLPANSIIIIGGATNPLAQPVYVQWKYKAGTVIATMMTLEYAYSRNLGTGKQLLLAEITYAKSLATFTVGGQLAIEQ
ncbi:MAG: hypothetical protein GXO68_04610, partial [Crenarchaeota archaeon]|nr:hypothetical protein [Thermoproteota archaeon]